MTGHGLLAPEAFCNCACFGADNFACCQNTAHTTVGVATHACSPFQRRWEARALRHFRGGSPGILDGRVGTNFLEDAILPEGPGGAICEDPPDHAVRAASSSIPATLEDRAGG